MEKLNKDKITLTRTMDDGKEHYTTLCKTEK